MLRSCSYCGKIHDTKVDCGKKPKTVKNTEYSKFRSTAAWTQKSIEIKHRDTFLCQICIRKLYNTVTQYNYSNLSVHHAIPIGQDESKRLLNSNLITICDYHHEMAESGRIGLTEIQAIIREQELRGTPQGY
jgi:5-methylcytosine-specific restriction endonuclease McrA